MSGISNNTTVETDSLSLHMNGDNTPSTNISWGGYKITNLSGFTVQEGDNKRMGIATLADGTVLVSTTAVTANSRIFLTIQSPSGTVGAVYVSGRTSGENFAITSTSATDASTVAYLIIEPA